MFRQEGVTTYSQLLFDVARQQVVVGARYVFSSQICLQLPSRDLLILSETVASHAILENRDNICFISVKRSIEAINRLTNLGRTNEDETR